MAGFVFENWPNNGGTKLRSAIGELISEGWQYRDAVTLTQRSYLMAVLFKMRGYPRAAIAARVGMSVKNLDYLIRKHKLRW